jgi:Protein of unknown function (DUF2806)
MVEIKDLVGLSKPAEKLIDVVAKGIGAICEPALIRRSAKAEADAAIIRAEADVKINDIAYRAKCRLEAKELRRQRNIEAVIERADRLLPKQVSSEPVSEEWAIKFFEDCQDITDDQLRGLWSRILAGEVTQPGTFSRRTLRVLKNASADDANNFQKLCSFLWWIPSQDKNVPKLVIPDVNDPALHQLGLNLEGLQELESGGLIHFQALGYSLLGKAMEAHLVYAQDNYKLSRDVEDQLPTGQVMLTGSGTELLHVVDGLENEAARNLALVYWEQRGWRTEKR